MDDLGYIGVLKVQISIYEATSLKDKRAVLNSLRDKIKHRYNISYSQIGYQESHSLAVLGFSCMSSSFDHCSKVLDNLERFLDMQADYEIIDKISYII